MDEGRPELETIMISGHDPAPASFDGLAQAIRGGSDALILTTLDGLIRRVIVTANNLSSEHKKHLAESSVLDVFASEEQALLASLLQKSRGTTHFEVGSFSVRLRDGVGPPVNLFISAIQGSHSEQTLLSWRLSMHPYVAFADASQSERGLVRRIEILEARCETHRRAAEQSRYALAALRDTNRSLARSLQAARERRDQQAAVLQESNRAKDELMNRLRQAWVSAVDARRHAEQDRQRLEIVSRASRVLGASLDHDTILQGIADVAVPMLADCCIVHLLDEDRKVLRHASVACAAPAVADRISAYPEYHVGRHDDTHPLYRAIHTGQSVVAQSPMIAGSQAEGDTCNFLTGYESLDITSCMVTVLRSRERIFGAITYASTNPERRYLPDDLLLAEEIAYRAGQALDNAMLYQQAEEAAKVRERYLSMASHELRSPLTVVSGFGALMLRQISEPEPDLERVTMLGRELQRGVERLELLTDGLLASGSLQSGRSEGSFVPVDLSALVEGLLTGMSSAPELVHSHTITFDGPDEVIGYCDAESIERAVLNIVSNALKYSPEGSNVHVWVYADEDVAAISVRDEGIGMSEEEQAELFSPFVRGRAARETAQGSGLGLYITKQIVEQHGGEIDVESQPNAGSTFTIHLPLNSSRWRAD